MNRETAGVVNPAGTAGGPGSKAMRKRGKGVGVYFVAGNAAVPAGYGNTRGTGGSGYKNCTVVTGSVNGPDHREPAGDTYSTDLPSCAGDSDIPGCANGAWSAGGSNGAADEENNGGAAPRWDTTVSSTYTSEKPTPTGSGRLPGSGNPGDNPDYHPGDVPPPAPPPREILPVWANILAIIGVLIASMFIGQVVDVVVRNGGEGDPGLAGFLSYVVSFGITIVFAWWLTTRKGTVVRPFSFSLRGTNPTLILSGLVMVMVTSMVLEPLLDLFPAEYLDRLQDAVGSGGWAMLTTIVAAPILEEMLFRGLIQQELTGGYGRVRGVVLAAAVFGVVHIIPQQAINAFFIGIILGYIYIRSGSLTPAILIHAINNAIAFTFLQLFGNSLSLTRDAFGNDSWYWTVYALCCIIFVVAGWRLAKALRTGPAGEVRAG